MKTLIEQEDEEMKEGRKDLWSLASPQTDPTFNNLKTRKLDQVL